MKRREEKMVKKKTECGLHRAVLWLIVRFCVRLQMQTCTIKERVAIYFVFFLCSFRSFLVPLFSQLLCDAHANNEKNDALSREATHYPFNMN